jgi:hypothetical protein
MIPMNKFCCCRQGKPMRDQGQYSNLSFEDLLLTESMQGYLDPESGMYVIRKAAGQPFAFA